MLLSIITINFNNAVGLNKTIKSVLTQNFTHIEYIIIDGGSTDGSKEIINAHIGKLSYWVSEKDNGIYHAMNKGLSKATGQYILFLNSGDTLLNNDVIQALFDNGNNADIIYGDTIFSDDKSSRNVLFPDKLTFKFFLINSLSHPSTIVRKELYDSIGGFFEHLKIVSDWAFFLLAINKFNYTYCHVPVLVSNFSLGGVSSRELENIEIEKAEILKEHFPRFLDDYKESEEIHKNLETARKQFGYRLHNKIKKIFS